jgi:hypothetical protein
VAHKSFQPVPVPNQPMAADSPMIGRIGGICWPPFGNGMPPVIPPGFQRADRRAYKGYSHQTPQTTPQPLHPVLARRSGITIIAVRAFGIGKPQIIQPVCQAAENSGESQAGPPWSLPTRCAIPPAAAGPLRFWVFRLRGHTVA